MCWVFSPRSYRGWHRKADLFMDCFVLWYTAIFLSIAEKGNISDALPGSDLFFVWCETYTTCTLKLYAKLLLTFPMTVISIRYNNSNNFYCIIILCVPFLFLPYPLGKEVLAKWLKNCFACSECCCRFTTSSSLTRFLFCLNRLEI